MLYMCSLHIVSEFMWSMDHYMCTSDSGNQASSLRIFPAIIIMSTNFSSQVHVGSRYSMVCTKTAQDSNDDSIAMLLMKSGCKCYRSGFGVYSRCYLFWLMFRCDTCRCVYWMYDSDYTFCSCYCCYFAWLALSKSLTKHKKVCPLRLNGQKHSWILLKLSVARQQCMESSG